MTRQTIYSAIVAAVVLSGCGSLPGLQSDSTEAVADMPKDVSDSSEYYDTETETIDETTATTVADPASGATAPATTNAVPPTTDAPIPTTAAPVGNLNINTDGPTVCLDALIEHLGPDAMINRMLSFFEVGDDIETPIIEEDEPTVPGELFICEADYQDPANPLKLLEVRMDVDTGVIGEPEPIEIDVVGDPTEFDLNDYLIKASEIDTSIIQPRMEEEAAGLDATYSVWRWSRVSLEAPDVFSDVPVFDLRMEGRLAQNDLTNSGYMTIAMDGTVIIDYLE